MDRFIFTIENHFEGYVLPNPIKAIAKTGILYRFIAYRVDTKTWHRFVLGEKTYSLFRDRLEKGERFFSITMVKDSPRLYEVNSKANCFALCEDNKQALEGFLASFGAATLISGPEVSSDSSEGLRNSRILLAVLQNLAPDTAFIRMSGDPDVKPSGAGPALRDGGRPPPLKWPKRVPGGEESEELFGKFVWAVGNDYRIRITFKTKDGLRSYEAAPHPELINLLKAETITQEREESVWSLFRRIKYRLGGEVRAYVSYAVVK